MKISSLIKPYLLFTLLTAGLSSLSFAAEPRDEWQEAIDITEKNIRERHKAEAAEKKRQREMTATDRALEKTHYNVTSSLFSVSDSIDTFFSNERSDQEARGSRIRFTYQTFFQEYEQPLHNLGLNTRIDLPRTKQRLKFLLQSLDDDPAPNNADPQTSQTYKANKQEEKKQSLFTGLRFNGIQTKEWSVNTDAGVKLVWPPDLFARLRLRRSFFFSDFELRLTESVFWFESKGWWQVATVELDRPLNAKHLLRWGNSGIRQDKIGYWDFAHFIAWYHRLSEKDALGYSTGISSSEEPAYTLTSYFVSISYRRDLFSKWIYLDISPTGAWPRQDNFVFTPSLNVKLEVIFGG